MTGLPRRNLAGSSSDIKEDSVRSTIESQSIIEHINSHVTSNVLGEQVCLFRLRKCSNKVIYTVHCDIFLHVGI